MNPRKMDNPNAERLATLIEELDNLSHALKLPMPAEMHIGPLKVALPEKVKRLKAVYVELFGENPWE